MRIIRNWSQEDYAGKLEMIREVDGKIECGVVERSLCALHPIDNALTIGSGIAAPPDRHPRSVLLENLFDHDHGIEMTISELESRKSSLSFPISARENFTPII
jgi:transcriptional regulator with XRE-family HTH domain